MLATQDSNVNLESRIKPRLQTLGCWSILCIFRKLGLLGILDQAVPHQEFQLVHLRYTIFFWTLSILTMSQSDTETVSF